MANKITKFKLANNQTYNVNDSSAVHFDASQSLSAAQKSQARTNIGAGTSSFSGNYDDLNNKPTIPSKTSQITNDSNFATTDYVDNKTAGLTGAMHFRGTVTALPVTTDYAAGDVVIFGSKEYVCDKDNNKWVELGDEGSHVLNTQKINGHALTGDITLNAADVGAATTADAAAATSKYYSATLTPAGWSASGSVFKNTYSNTELRASVSPVVSCTENAAEYAYITDAEATAKTGIVFTARKKPTANVILTIVDVG